MTQYLIGLTIPLEVEAVAITGLDHDIRSRGESPTIVSKCTVSSEEYSPPYIKKSLLQQ